MNTHTGKKTRKSSRKKNINLAAKRRRDIIVITGCALMALIGGYAWSTLHGEGIVKTEPRQAIVSDEVLVYEPLIEQYAEEYGVSDFVPVIEAMMQQESGGKGDDVMQCSECFYNTEYEQSPNGITDPEYSVDTGVHYFSHCLDLAECEDLNDMDRLKLALQGYNFGHNYINWAIERDGGYTEENAQVFSEMMQENLGWTGYGDPSYVEHVLRYYQ